jgi:uncharacterized hydrophobic protein (TIGR00271 family)
MLDAQRDIGYADVERMRDRLLITAGPDWRRKWSAFWVLLVLATVIATAGVIADSTATVIGAMIVAPLMTPILGTALSLVLGDRQHLVHCVGLVAGGALAVVVIAFAIGLFHVGDVTSATNSQVAGRVSPGLIDLVAALATGVVGAFALVRSDVSDTLPGVAIAISLVPPLAVVGLTLESGAADQARGAMLLFTTNVAAIIATGTIVLLMYRVRSAVARAGEPLPELGSRTLAVVLGTVLLVAVPLGYGSWTVAEQTRVIARAKPVADRWAEAAGWIVTDVTFQQGRLSVIALGSPPEANAEELRQDLDDAGLQDIEATVTLVLGGSKELPATG